MNDPDPASAADSTSDNATAAETKRRPGSRPLLLSLLVTAGLLFLSRLLMTLPVFGTRVREIGLFRDENLRGILQDIPGLAHSVSFGALGILPYLGICLFIQLAVPIIPPLRELARKGNDRAIQIIIWIGTGMYTFIVARMMWPPHMGMGLPFDFPVFAAVQMVIGVFMLVAIGHAITKWGIGNGIVLLLAAETLAAVPDAGRAFVEMLGGLGPGSAPNAADGPSLFQMLVLFPGAFLLVVGATAAFFSAQRRLSVVYEDGERASEFPVPLWCAGILPLVAAQSWLMFGPALAQFFHRKLNLPLFGTLREHFSMDRPAYHIAFMLLIVLFCVWWSRRLLDHTHVARSLAECGGRIEGVPPGPETALFLKRTMTRLSLSGGVFLMLVCILPLVLNHLGLPFILAQYTGGLAILISVAAFLDFFKQFKAARR